MDHLVRVCEWRPHPPNPFPCGPPDGISLQRGIPPKNRARLERAAGRGLAGEHRMNPVIEDLAATTARLSEAVGIVTWQRALMTAQHRVMLDALRAIELAHDLQQAI